MSEIEKLRAENERLREALELIHETQDLEFDDFGLMAHQSIARIALSPKEGEE